MSEIALHITVDSDLHHGTPVSVGTCVPAAIAVASISIAFPLVFLNGSAVALASTNQSSILAQLRRSFPKQVSQLETECYGNSKSPMQQNRRSYLQLQLYQNAGESKRVSFSCWDAPPTKGKERSGSWLGNLPLSNRDRTFAKPWTCAKGDRACSELLPQLRSRFPQQLQQAKFQCGIKNGILFAIQTNSNIDIRCGFFAVTLWDSDGDGKVDNEGQASVDISIATFKL